MAITPYIVAVARAVLPEVLRNRLFRFGVKIAPGEFRRYAYHHAFAPSMEEALKKIRKRDFVPTSIVDVGAYHGDWTRLVHRVWPEAALVMVEANLDKRSVLEPIAADLGASLHFALLGPTDGREVVFHVMESGSSVFEENSPLDRRAETRTTSRLDTVLEKRRVDLLKLDVQGFELEVLKGAPEILKSVQAVILEVAILQINRDAPLLDEVVAFMKEKGFIVCDVLELHRRPLDQATNQVDLLFVPETSPLMADTRHF